MRLRDFAGRSLWEQMVRRVEIKPEMFLYLAFALLILPFKWVLAMIIAAAFHELCHFVALRLCGREVYGMTIGVAGAIMDTSPLSEGKEMCCALAGPLGSVLLVSASGHYPELAICGAIHAAFNLLPLMPLDGGRALRCLLCLLMGVGKGIRLHKLTEKGAICILMLLVIYLGAKFAWNRFSLLVSIMLLIRLVHRKIPCKDSELRVQ